MLINKKKNCPNCGEPLTKYRKIYWCLDGLGCGRRYSFKTGELIQFVSRKELEHRRKLMKPKMKRTVIGKAVRCGNSAHVMLPVSWRNRPVVVVDKGMFWGRMSDVRREVI